MPAQKSRLGRGLDSLISAEPHPLVPSKPLTASDVDAPAKPGSVEFIPLDQIQPNPHQPRSSITPDSLSGLVDSLRTSGFLQPILVRRHNDAFQLIAGERRWRAAQEASLTTIPAIVREASEKDMIEIALIENIQRENLTPVEEAMGYKSLMETVELSQEEVARRVGKNRATVANALRLLKLPPVMLETLDRGDITAGHARALLAVVNPADQEVLLRRILDGALSVREAERQVQELNAGGRGRSTKQSGPRLRRQTDPALDSARQALIDGLGTKVEIRGTARKGQIAISYYSPEDLDRLIALLSR